MDNTAKLPPVSPTLRLTGWVLLVMFAVIVAGSIVFKVEIVARGQGRIVPLSRVQTIQSRLKGKIAAIQVREGQAVAKGSTLILLDDTEARSAVNQLQTNLEALQEDHLVAASIIEPLSKIDPASDDFTKVKLENGPLSPGRLDSASALVAAVLTSIRDEIAQLDSELTKNELAQGVALARLENARSTAQILSDKFSSSAGLQEQGVISKSDYLDRLREIKTSEGEVTVAERMLQELSAERDSIRKQRQKVISTALMTYRRQFNETSNAIDRASAELVGAGQVLSDTKLIAPVDGIVENLTATTIGGFLDEGTVAMTIVPEDTGFEIEAFFDNRDVGFLRAGQKAFVKMDAFPSERFGIFKGEVMNVGADARQDSTRQQWVYATRLKLTAAPMPSSIKNIKLAAGMTSTIDVITGERRLISYFFEPLVKAMQDSLRER